MHVKRYLLDVAAALAAYCLQRDVDRLQYAIVSMSVRGGRRKAHSLSDLCLTALTGSQMAITLESASSFDTFRTVTAAIPVGVVVRTETAPFHHWNDPRTMKNEEGKENSESRFSR
ncbi:MAG: hypothetical protein AB1733_16855 [Thermodesulfobacteriota bacterium]